MAISAKDVAALRTKTGCGMMECKKSLTEANGDFDAAIKLLREKGLSVAAKKQIVLQPKVLLILWLAMTVQPQQLSK